MEFMYYGPCPYDEDPIQFGDEDYLNRSIEECRKFLHLLRAKFGKEPDGAHLRIKKCDHDFGAYYEVVCAFDELCEHAVEYAFRIDKELPAKWE